MPIGASWRQFVPKNVVPEYQKFQNNKQGDKSCNKSSKQVSYLAEKVQQFIASFNIFISTLQGVSLQVISNHRLQIKKNAGRLKIKLESIMQTTLQHSNRSDGTVESLLISFAFYYRQLELGSSDLEDEPQRINDEVEKNKF